MEEWIKINCDGGSRGNPGPAASACVVFKNGQVVASLSKYLGETTNNVAEYGAVILAFGWLTKNKEEIGNLPIKFYLDSELVVRQLIGKYKIKKDHLKKMFEEIKRYENDFMNVSYTHVLRSKNEVADSLVNEKLDSIR